ncbi:hypothetical protein GS935_26035 [Rhodococcus hoagii]|nr:hypothetical protein [Prescottella equi]
MHREDMPDEARARAEQVAFDMLAPLDERIDVVPLPADPRPGWWPRHCWPTRGPAEPRRMGRDGRASVRTLTRVFSQGTG